MKPLRSAKTNNRNFQDSTQKQGEVLNPKSFSEKEKTLYQKVFSPKIKRTRKPYKKRSVRKVCEDFYEHFKNEKEIPYDVAKRWLIQEKERCSRQTILAYLGRPFTRQVNKVDDNVLLQGGGSRIVPHEYVRNLPKKTGYIELFGFAFLFTDSLTGKTWFKNHRVEQARIDSPLQPPQTRASL